MSEPDWYKRYPRRFLEGVQGMGPEVIGAYSVLLDMIYARDGDMPRDDRHLAGVMGCSVRKARALTEALIAAGKITEEGGRLANRRSSKEIFARKKWLENSAKGGRTKAENDAADNENNGLTPSIKIREDKIPIAKAIGADAPRELSFHDAIWTRGVLFLTERGVTEKNARAFLGKAKKANGDEAVFNALASAAKAGAVDPIPYITKALQSVAHPEAQKLEAWGIPDAQPVRPLPRIADIDTKKPTGAPDMPKLQREQKEESREMLVCDSDDRGNSDILPPLRAQCGSKA